MERWLGRKGDAIRIGGYYYKTDGHNLEELLDQADKLMYSAKKSGGKRIHFSEFKGKSNIQKSEKSTYKK